MKQIIRFRFSENVKLFRELAKFTYHSVYKTGFLLTLPIDCYIMDTDFFRKKLLFKTNFTCSIDSFEQIKEYSENFNYSSTKQFFDKFFPESTFLNDLKQKALKWIDDKILEPIKIEQTDYICGTEFIQVDADSSFYGNFIQNEKEGCHMRFGKNTRCSKLIDMVHKTKVSYYDLPYKVRQASLEMTDKKWYYMSEVDRYTYLENLGLKVMLNIWKENINQNHSHSIDASYCPFFIKLSGNDDDSWTKYFCTEEEMMQEVYRLRRCQPINKEIDVENNGYYFTN